ncbi:thioesterase family protein [Rhodococcus sp. IEGM 1381]|uniref:acyl-CoA thioesterase n=1 Tax=Rhodococcus sp. IEGM 1381 TaxID=3047085 RepID=UPI0024B65DD5|nr:thioesterase family protein [Rhodococcus sp. IEGM 1381]MDI9896884.1 thioesterase family protein [Rhodococcus sp. IEGM 1381]
MTDPRGISAEARVEWSDTDAAGHYHHSTVIRWVEAAEAALLRSIGRADLFGVIPRVSYSVEYRGRVWFGDAVTTTLTVQRVGTSSLTYGFVVDGPNRQVAEGSMTVVHTGTSSTGSAPWPADVKSALQDL